MNYTEKQVLSVRIAKLGTSDLAMPMLFLLLALWCSLFDVVHTSESYRYLQPVGNVGWSLIFGALGLAKAVSIIYNLCRLRQILIVVCFLLWITIAALILRANPMSPTVPACFYFMYQLALSWWRLTV